MHLCAFHCRTLIDDEDENENTNKYDEINDDESGDENESTNEGPKKGSAASKVKEAKEEKLN